MRLLICSSCSGARDREVEELSIKQALEHLALAEQVEVTEHACFSGCAEPVALAMQAEGRATYVFSGVNVTTDADDIAATCQAYLDSPKGWIEDARPCGRLRMCLRARIPAL